MLLKARRQRLPTLLFTSILQSRHHQKHRGAGPRVAAVATLVETGTTMEAKRRHSKANILVESYSWMLNYFIDSESIRASLRKLKVHF